MPDVRLAKVDPDDGTQATDLLREKDRLREGASLRERRQQAMREAEASRIENTQTGSMADLPNVARYLGGLGGVVGAGALDGPASLYGLAQAAYSAPREGESFFERADRYHDQFPLGQQTGALYEAAQEYASGQGIPLAGQVAAEALTPLPSAAKLKAAASAAAPLAKAAEAAAGVLAASPIADAVRAMPDVADAIGDGLLAAVPAAARAESKAGSVDELLLQHNLSGENVLHADEIGGLAMPSMAITRAENPLTGYGEVSLLGDEAMATPSRTNPVFAADAYSPRYPTVETQITGPEHSRLQASLGESFGEDSLWRAPRDENGNAYAYFDFDSDLRDKGVDRFLEHDAVKARFLHEQGAMPETSGLSASEWQRQTRQAVEARREEFDAWKAGYLERTGIEPERKIFRGFTDLGNRRYRPETLENVVKEMKAEMRGADGSAGLYGAGALRALLTPQLRSMKEIRAARDRLDTPENVEAYKAAMNDKLGELAGRLADHLHHKSDNPFITTDIAISNLGDVLTGGARWDDWFANVPADLKQEAIDFADELRNGPTAYFESKPKRGVELSEFRVAMVPEDADAKVVKALERQGIRVERYADEEDRVRKIGAQRDLMFQYLAPLLLGGGAGAAAMGGANPKAEVAANG